jgi:RNA recognition motif-containing protein
MCGEKNMLEDDPNCNRDGADSMLAGLNRGKAALEFEHPDEAEKAIKHMDGGQLDGSFVTVQVSQLAFCGWGGTVFQL